MDSSPIPLTAPPCSGASTDPSSPCAVPRPDRPSTSPRAPAPSTRPGRTVAGRGRGRGSCSLRRRRGSCILVHNALPHTHESTSQLIIPPPSRSSPQHELLRPAPSPDPPEVCVRSPGASSHLRTPPVFPQFAAFTSIGETAVSQCRLTRRKKISISIP